MSTVYGLIKRTLRDAGIVGVGQAPAAEDMNDAFDKLNSMLAQFSKRRWLIYELLDLSFVSTGAQTYTIGPNCNFNCVRPDRIQSAFIRQVTSAQPVDFAPLNIIEAREDYNRIALKTLASIPRHVFLDSGYPTGTLYFWPVPPASLYEMHVTVKSPLQTFTALMQTIVLPPEYDELIVYNLAVRLRPAYEMPPDPTITQLAKAALNTIKNANTQMPRLRMPAALRGRGSYYDPISDRTY